MTIQLIVFLVLWGCITTLSVYWVLRAKKLTSRMKMMLMILVIVVPILNILFVYIALKDSHDLPWQNSATKDTAWLADNDTYFHADD